MRNRKFLLALAGLPASGKSTLAELLKEAIEGKDKRMRIKIVDPDEIRADFMPSRFIPEKESEVRQESLERVEDALKRGWSVINDDLNYYTSMRHDLKHIAEENDAEFFIIHVSTPLTTCKNWNDERGRTIPNQLIEDISRKFDAFGGYQWESPLVRIDPSEPDDMNEKVSKMAQKLLKRLKMRPQRFNIEQPPSRRDHERLDELTRRVVGNLLRTPGNRSLKRRILSERKQFVKENLGTSLEEREIREGFKKHLKANVEGISWSKD